jgi:polyphosphate kinase 2 (PPK2 family)
MVRGDYDMLAHRLWAQGPQRLPSYMKSTDFVVIGRPRLAAIKSFPVVEFANYERRLAEMQETLQRLQQAYLGTSHRAIIVLEGWDTAGKGGVVRRLGWALDPRSFKVHAIVAPSSREKSLHYLQRFWERLPEHGQIVVFDRSWYGRVLVERVEAYATSTEWRRAYNEINDFERMLLEDNTRLVKIFLHITPDEQMHRFRARLTDPLKRWKLSYEDFRNRGRWKDYEGAIEDMVETTSTKRPLASCAGQRQAVRSDGRVPHHRRSAIEGGRFGAARARSQGGGGRRTVARDQAAAGQPSRSLIRRGCALYDRAPEDSPVYGVLVTGGLSENAVQIDQISNNTTYTKATTKSRRQPITMSALAFELLTSIFENRQFDRHTPYFLMPDPFALRY